MKTAQYIRRKAFDNEKGSAMLAVMVTLVALTVIGIAATRTSTFESASSGNQKRKQAAFYAAEAGLEHGKAILMDKIEKDHGGNLPDKTGWSFILDGTGGTLPAADSDEWDEKHYWESGVSIVSNVSFFDGKYKYTVKVWNNKEEASATDDTDQTIIMRSQAEGIKNGEFAAVEISMGAGLGKGDEKFTEEQTAQEGAGTGKNYNANDAKAVEVAAADGGTNYQSLKE